MSSFESEPEAKFEEQVVNQLASGEGQWSRCKHLNYATEHDLWDNFFHILNKNNAKVLKHVKLNEKEEHQIIRKIEDIDSPYEAAKFLEGENGDCKITVSRENNKLNYNKNNTVLTIFKKDNINGGSSSYQIAEQPKRKSKGRLKNKDRRFDVSLLINGLPLIQLELKKSTVELGEAFDQVQKYADEGMYGGIFSLIQMFVIMTPDRSAYFANCKPGHFNPSFVFDWRDVNNNRVEDGLDFTKQVLNIPMAHEMVSEYTVIDEERKQLILLRPYQIYAIQAVMNRIHHHQNGFVWNTMGSGKTLTSYKTAKLAAQDPNIYRVLFVVDRKALDKQTNSNFEAYAANDDMAINNANTTEDLRRKIMSDNGKILITSIQKLYQAVKDEQAKAKQGKHTKFSKLFNKRIAFFVDEIQRSQFGDMQRTIRKAFPEGRWYGYTGTPIFTQNAKKVGDQWMTTEDLFGKVCKPVYTIRTALDDHAVLRCGVRHMSTIKYDNKNFTSQFRHQIIKKLIDQKEKHLMYNGSPIPKHLEDNIKDKILNTNMAELEDKYIPNSEYDTQQHIDKVVKYIMEYGSHRTLLDHGDFNAILTTSSIHMALRYYDTFKRVKNNHTLMAKYKAFHKDHDYSWDKHWPNIAVTYSLQEDNDPKNALHKKTIQVLNDYNNQYFDGHHTYGIDNFNQYNADVAKRTARRDPNYVNLLPKHQINLCIVVDRLLTGFDAPRLNTLFVDRILQLQQLIQAYSRTNRLCGKDKLAGQIVTFRKPFLMEHNERKAYLLYAGKGSLAKVMQPHFDEASKEFKHAVHALKQFVPTADSVDKLAGTNDKVKFIKLFRNMIRKLNAIHLYDEFTWKNSKSRYGIAEKEVQHYVGKYNGIKNEVQLERRRGDNNDLVGLDFSLSLNSITHVTYDSITRLIEQYGDAIQQRMLQNSENNEKNETDSQIHGEISHMEHEIESRIKEYSSSGHPKKAQLLHNEFKYFIHYVNSTRDYKTSATNIMYGYKNHQYTKHLMAFSNKWHVDANCLDEVAHLHKHNSQFYPHEIKLRKTVDTTDIKLPRVLYVMKAENHWRKFINDVLDVYL